VATMGTNKTICTGMESKLADLLLDPKAVPAKVHAHVAECEHCRTELAELKAAMAMLDEWKAPEPSPYFMTRMNAKMREERETAQGSWLARKINQLRAGFVYGPASHARPLAAMALTVMLLVGGGTYLGVTDWNHTAQPQPQNAAVVHDLQLLDNNSQILDQLEAMSSSNNQDGD
jgi:anti-sigma factor RsiW